MPTRDSRPTDPDFPHGSQQGYNMGCRPKHYACPASPTCGEKKTEAQRALRKVQGRQAAHPDWPKTKQVQRRLAQTVAKVGYDAITERTGLTLAQVRKVERIRKISVDPTIAEPLDHAWTYFVWGVDSTAPEFIHGRVTSYNRYGCRCGKCRRAQSNGQAKTRAGIGTDHSIIEVPGLAAHAQRLSDVAGPIPAARAAGVAVSALKGARAGKRVRTSIARKLLATKPADVARTVRILPSARAHQQLRSMWALGYPMRWIADQHEALNYSRVTYVKPDGYVLVDVAEAIAEVARKVGDTPAGPEHGITSKSANQARANARRMGVYPPMFYDAHGNLDVRAIPDHPWAKLDAKADRLLTIAHLLITTQQSQEAIGAVVAASDKTVSRISRSLGLVYERNGYSLDWRASAAGIARVREVYGAYEDGIRGPVEACLMLGLMDTETRRKDHPEVAAWIAARTLAWAMLFQARYAPTTHRIVQVAA